MEQKIRVTETITAISESVKNKDEKMFDTYADLGSICGSFYDQISKSLSGLGVLVDKKTITEKCLKDTKQYILGGGITSQSSLLGSLDQLVKEKNKLVVTQKSGKVLGTLTQDKQTISLEFAEKNQVLVWTGLAIK